MKTRPPQIIKISPLVKINPHEIWQNLYPGKSINEKLIFAKINLLKIYEQNTTFDVSDYKLNHTHTLPMLLILEFNPFMAEAVIILKPVH